MEPNHTGQQARYLDATGCADAIAVWLSVEGAVWVTDEGEIAMRSKYTGGYVAPWHGYAIIAAQRWCDTKMPVSRGETITGERAEHTPNGTVLARVGADGRVIAGKRVIEKDAGFTAAHGYYRVLDTAREVRS